MKLSALESVAAKLDVTFDQHTAGTGQGITVNWRLPKRIETGTNRLYLMFEAPQAVRFAGLGFFALAPHARGPAGIKHAQKSTRIIVPLHVKGNPTRGTFLVRSYRAGEMPIAWSLVARSRCGEHLLGKTKAATVTVTYGRPDIVVQDVFADDTPKKTIITNDGRYKLLVFKDHYQVFETSTGAKIVDRVGVQPNFSPTGRFLVAKGYSKEQLQVPLGLGLHVYHDVIDLINGELILNDVTGPVGWTHGDSFIIDGGVKGRLNLRHSLIDRKGSQKMADRDSLAKSAEDEAASLNAAGQRLGLDICWWKGCPAWRESYVARINIDDGFARIFVDRGIDGKFLYLANLSLNHLTLVGKQECKATKATSEGGSAACRAQRFTPARAMKRVAAACCSRSSQWRDVTRTARFTHLHDWGLSKQLDRRIVTHSQTDNGRTGGDGNLRVAQAGAVQTVSGGWRAAIPISPTAAAQPAKQQSNQLFDRLSAFGIHADAGLTPEFRKPRRGKELPEDATEEQRLAFLRKHWQPLISEVGQDVPIAPQILSPGGGGACFAPEGGQIGLDGVSGMWRWRLPNGLVWMFQATCSVGTTPFTPFLDLDILYAQKGTQGTFQPLVPGYNDLPQNKNVKYTISRALNKIAKAKARLAKREMEPDEIPIAMAKAIGNEPIRFKAYSDGLLLLPFGQQLAVYNVKTNTVQKIINDLAPHGNDLQVYLTKDRRHVIQFNADGRLFVFSLSTGKRVLTGRYVDDEIILYDDNGYYDSTYEGAHYVNLKFPGDFGLYSFQQFASKLHRPQLVKARLAGQTSFAPPNLTAPPNLSFTLTRDGAGALIGEVRAASPAGLRTVRLYQDGQFLAQVPASGRNLSQRLKLEPKPGMRWITASATDQLGLTSRPVAALLPAAATASAKLRAVVVGIDAYEHQNLSPLTYAVTDSKTISRSLNSVKGRYYGEIDVAHLTDKQAGSAAILDRLEETVARSEIGDTMVFFFAGHGVRGPGGKYYLATSETDPNDPGGNALDWAKVKTVLARSKARVIVLLDACHSGLAGAEAFASNDDAVAQFLTDVQVPILVLAASKGRQFSQERSNLNGGVFTRALETVINKDWRRFDRNKNGVIDVSEMYLGVKSNVKKLTNGEQTPWLARSDLVGDFALF